MCQGPLLFVHATVQDYGHLIMIMIPHYLPLYATVSDHMQTLECYVFATANNSN